MCCSSRELDSKTRTYLVRSSPKKSFQRSTLSSATTAAVADRRMNTTLERERGEGEKGEENTAQSWSPCHQRQRTRKMDNHYRSSEARNYSIRAVFIIEEEEKTTTSWILPMHIDCRLDMNSSTSVKGRQRERERINVSRQGLHCKIKSRE